VDNLPLEVLQDTFPERIFGEGGPKTLRYIKDNLPKLDLSWGADGYICGLNDADWQTWLENLTTHPNGRRMSFSSRRRYRAHLLSLANLWTEANLLPRTPALTVSKQYTRTQTVPIDRIRYRFSHYFRILQYLADALMGVVPPSRPLVPDFFNQNTKALTAIVMLFSGLAIQRPVAQLTILTWQDVMPRGVSVLRISPSKGQYRYLPLLPMAHLLFCALRYKAKKPALEKFVFSEGNYSLAEQIRKTLRHICQDVGVPEIGIKCLIPLARMHLRQALSNIDLAALIGQVNPPAVPTEQLPLLFYNLSRNQFEDTLPDDDTHSTLELLLDAEELSTIPEDPATDDLRSEYADLLGELKPYLRLLNNQSEDTSIAMDRLETWIERRCTSKNIPDHNLSLMLSWLIDMHKLRQLKPLSITRYWFAAMQVILLFPGVPIEQIDTEHFEVVLEQGYAAATLRVTKSAWKRLRIFLSQKGMELTDINWRILGVPRHQPPKPALLKSHLQEWISTLGETTEAQAAIFSLRTGLRVSEVCRIRVCDIIWGRLPYIVVRPSKRGQQRRVNLMHLSRKELETIRGRLKTARKLFGPNAYLFANEQGSPLYDKRLSRIVGKALNETSLLGNKKNYFHYHDLRAAAAGRFFNAHKDVRYAAAQLGHALASTTTSSYLINLVDIACWESLQSWRTPLNRQEMYVPLKILAALLGLTDRRISQMVTEHNQTNLGKPIHRQTSVYPHINRPGRAVGYLQLEDAIRLVEWRIFR